MYPVKFIYYRNNSKNLSLPSVRLSIFTTESNQITRTSACQRLQINGIVANYS